MTQKEIKLTPALLDEMIENDWIKESRGDFMTMHDIMPLYTSPMDQIREHKNRLFDTISSSLKKMKADSVASIIKNCYKENWMNPDFTNTEQIR